MILDRVAGVTALEVSGTPHDQGAAQGAALADRIAVNLEQVDALIDRLGLDRAAYAGHLALASEHIASRDAATLEEIRGIAEGSGMPYDDVLRLNIPLYMVMRRSKIVDDCSVFAVPASETADGKTYLVKTRDQPVDQFAYEHVALTRRYDDGSAIIEVNAAGLITNPGNGINSAGLAVGTAGVWSKDQMGVRLSQLRSSWPMPDMHYLLRNASTVKEAKELWQDWPRLVGMNLLVADADGGMGTIELTATEVVWTPSIAIGCGLTNHYVDAELSKLSKTPEEYPSTHARLRFLNARLAEDAVDGRQTTEADLVAIMTDRSQGTQDSIWRTLPGDSVTRYGSVMCIDDRSATTWGEDLEVDPVESRI